MSVPAPSAAAAAPALPASVAPLADGQQGMQAAAAAPVVLTPEQEAKLNEDLEAKLDLLWASAAGILHGVAVLPPPLARQL